MPAPKTPIPYIIHRSAENCMADIREPLEKINQEMHTALQLPPEDLAKIDHIEWKLDWKPVLTARLYPKKS